MKTQVFDFVYEKIIFRYRFAVTYRRYVEFAGVILHMPSAVADVSMVLC